VAPARLWRPAPRHPALSTLSSGSESETECVAWRTTSDSQVDVGLPARLRERAVRGVA
jgi:hypothetical protein